MSKKFTMKRTQLTDLGLLRKGVSYDADSFPAAKKPGAVVKRLVDGGLAVLGGGAKAGGAKAGGTENGAKPAEAGKV